MLRKHDQHWRVYGTLAHRSRNVAYHALTSNSEFKRLQCESLYCADSTISFLHRLVLYIGFWDIDHAILRKHPVRGFGPFSPFIPRPYPSYCAGVRCSVSVCCVCVNEGRKEGIQYGVTSALTRLPAETETEAGALVTSCTPNIPGHHVDPCHYGAQSSLPGRRLRPKACVPLC